MNHQYYLSKTIEFAVENVKNEGGPFAAIVVNSEGEVVGLGLNRVTQSHDPTAHAEVQAIREACKNLNHFQLDDCVLYTSCEPCPMCLGAIYWARLKEVYYAADQHIAAKGGFDDAFIYDEIPKNKKDRKIPFHSLSLKNRNAPFKKWMEHDLKTAY